jgi:hypothetical protein
MNKLEKLLDSHDNSELSINNLDYKNFGYQDNLVFNHHLKFLLENCYNIKLKNEQRIRLNQKKFRKELLKKFNGKCIISGNDCEDELTAAHIVPVADEESYDIDNGLLLTDTLHKTMDKFKWAINPDTLIIEVKSGVNVGSIRQYAGQKVNLVLNPELKANLQTHWEEFIKID